MFHAGDASMITRVVHVGSQEWKDTPEGRRVYIGRAMPRQRLRGSIYANPFRVDELGRDEALRRYEQSWREQLRRRPWEMELARELMVGKVLGCWCKAKKPGGVSHACH